MLWLLLWLLLLLLLLLLLFSFKCFVVVDVFDVVLVVFVVIVVVVVLEVVAVVLEVVVVVINGRDSANNGGIEPGRYETQTRQTLLRRKVWALTSRNRPF